MLSHLFIRNIAVIEEAAIDFSEGLNVFTGETGAGKSIVIHALNGILGGRISKDIVRQGAQKATVTALFTELGQDIEKKLEEMDFDIGDSELLISREITESGRSSCKINGQPATVSMLRELGKMLINIHGQHDNEELLNEQKHIQFIDQFGDFDSQLEEYRSQYRQLQEIKKELDTLMIDDAQKLQMKDLLSYQIREIEAAHLKEGEEETLSVQKERIRNAQKISDAMQTVHRNLNGGIETEGAMQLIKQTSYALQQVTPYLPDFKQGAEKLDNLYYELEEINEEVRSYLDDEENQYGDLDAIESRLDIIYRLKLKYGDSVEKILQYLEDCQQKLDQLETSNERALQLKRHLKIIEERAQNLAQQLSEQRQKSAARFCELVSGELSFLEMPFVTFQPQQKMIELTPNGMDQLYFMISTNPGEPPKPIDRIASGGELSRVMLAFKCVLADRDAVGTLVFDEIDTGVSGRTAQKIGRKLKQVSTGRQVICITHLAQVAAFADHHLLIEKHLDDTHTYTQVRILSQPEREQEIARIIGGSDLTELSLNHARELIEQSHMMML